MREQDANKKGCGSVILALRWPTVVQVLVLAVLGGVCLFIFIDGVASSADIWARRGVFVALISIFIGALGNPQVFGFVHKITFAKHWMFPLLDGHWTARLCSNWPRVRRTYEAARNGGPPFDALNDDLSDDEESERYVEADVTISSSLFVITLTLRPLSSNRVSRTRFMRPVWNKPDLPELSYVFEQEDLDPIARTDAKTHYGAGIIRYDPETGQLAGNYWNDRKEDAGLNTAGTIRMTRLV